MGTVRKELLLRKCNWVGRGSTVRYIAVLGRECVGGHVAWRGKGVRRAGFGGEDWRNEWVDMWHGEGRE